MSKEIEERKTTVLFIWEVSEKLKSHLTQELHRIQNVDLIFPSDVSQENLIKLAHEAGVMVGWRPTKELLLAAEKLELFINPGAGVQHLIDLFRDVNSSRRILLANCHGNSYFVAQHVVALLLSLTNKIIPHHNWMVAGQWRKRDDDAKSIPLRKRKLGLLGYGAINKKVHRFLSGFDLEFSILRRDWSRQSEKLPTSAQKYDLAQLHPFLSAIDTLVVAIPQTSLTRNLIGMKELELLGSDGILVNVSRGPIINEKDLFEALKKKTIAGAAIDVWYNYNPVPDEESRKYPSSCPFHTLQNVVLSPHRGGSPNDDLHRWNEVIENIKRFAIHNDQFSNIVDLEEEY